MSPRWLHWPGAVSAGTDYTDKFVVNSDYWIIPAGTGPTSGVARTGGTSDTGWTEMRMSQQAGNTATTSAGTVTLDTYFEYVIQNNNYGATSNPYTYCASYHDGVLTAGNNANPDGPGWVIWQSESVPGTLGPGRQSYVPIEVQSGVVVDSGSTTHTGPFLGSTGYGPIWSRTLTPSVSNSFVFFFNSYTTGEVQSWSAWDGASRP